jgi:hypothetical protein
MFGEFGGNELSLIVALCLLLGVASRVMGWMWKPAIDARGPTADGTRSGAYIDRLFGRAS